MKPNQSQPPLTDAQRAELDRRLDAYESDGNRGRPAAEALAELRAMIAEGTTGAGA